MTADDRTLIAETIAAIEPLDPETSAAAAGAMDGKVKPLRSLGELERIAARLAGIQRTPHPHVEHPAVIVCAADHGIAASGVSAYPQEVTGLMLQGFAAGTAAVGVLTREAGARLIAIDPIRTRTAAQCDEHLPIRPGTDAAQVGRLLALGYYSAVVRWIQVEPAPFDLERELAAVLDTVLVGALVD